MASSDTASDSTSRAALLALHGASEGTKATGDALQSLADAGHDEIPSGARLDVLHGLAAAGFPGREDNPDEYRNLAASVGADVEPDQVLDDVASAAAGTSRLDDTATGQALNGTNSIAFVGADLCSVQKVKVNGKPAMWVFSEFETNAPFEEIAEWVNPMNWSERAPMMFKSMAPEPGHKVEPLPGAGVRWHGDFEEKVEFGKFLVTGLHCDFVKEETYAAVTYRWNWSQGDQITVDRGFLMVNNLGKNRQVKVLKIVSFTDQALDRYADTVCPFWTDFIRGAVREGDQHSAATPTTTPTKSFFGPKMREIGDIYRQGIRDYTDFAGDWARRAMSGDYGPREFVLDSSGYMSELAKDWARAWTAGNSMLADMAGSTRTFAAFGGPGGRDGTLTEGTTVPMPNIDVNARVTCSDLTLLGSSAGVIPTSKISVSLVRLEGGALGVHLEAATSGVAVGMYLGELTVGANGRKRPVQLYVSHSLA